MVPTQSHFSRPNNPRGPTYFGLAGAIVDAPCFWIKIALQGSESVHAPLTALRPTIGMFPKRRAISASKDLRAVPCLPSRWLAGIYWNLGWVISGAAPVGPVRGAVLARRVAEAAREAAGKKEGESSSSSPPSFFLKATRRNLIQQYTWWIQVVRDRYRFVFKYRLVDNIDAVDDYYWISRYGCAVCVCVCVWPLSGLRVPGERIC